MVELAGSAVLVVGASGVLGASLTRRLSAAGARVWGTASSHESLARIPETVNEKAVCALTDETSIRATADWIRAGNQSLAGVIVAAGVVSFGPFRETPPEVVDHLFRVNATGPMALIASLSDLLAAGSDAFVVTLSGKVAEVPTAGLAAYSASKSALHACALAAARELRRDGVRWLDARPGHTETGLADRAVFGQAPALGQGLDPERVSERIMMAIQSDERDLPSEAFS